MSNLEWLIVGLALVLLELFVPGTYLIWFGFAGLLVAVLTSFFAWALITQVVVFTIFSFLFALVGWRVYGRLITKTPSNSEYRHLNDFASQYIGKKYMLDEDVVDNRSKVRVGDTVWIASCNEPLKKGQTVEVVGVKKGVILEVKSV